MNSKINSFIKDPRFKNLRWVFVLSALLLFWQIYSNYKASEMFKDNSPTEWDANGPGYHK